MARTPRASAGRSADPLPALADRRRRLAHLAVHAGVRVAVDVNVGPAGSAEAQPVRDPVARAAPAEGGAGPDRDHERAEAPIGGGGDDAIEVMLVLAEGSSARAFQKAAWERNSAVGAGESAGGFGGPAMRALAAVSAALTAFHRLARTTAATLRADGYRVSLLGPWNRTPRAVQVRSTSSVSSGERPTVSTSSGRSASMMRCTASMTRTCRGASVEWCRYSSANHHSETPFHANRSRKLRPSASGRRPHSFVQAMAASSISSWAAAVSDAADRYGTKAASKAADRSPSHRSSDAPSSWRARATSTPPSPQRTSAFTAAPPPPAAASPPRRTRRPRSRCAGIPA